MNWGKIEHNFENRTMVLLLPTTAAAVLFLLYGFEWLAYATAALTLLVTVTHTIARLAHLLEKRQWRNADWSPRGGRKR